jgi:heme/copper-type cytochrome/quinol oxidase subunit 3
MWWGTMGLIVIEGTVFVGAIATYFYLRELVTVWPPNQAAPALLYGTLHTVILLLSAIPNQWTKTVAEQEDLRATRIGLVICLIFGAVLLAIRAYEFTALHVMWYESAYGSIVYALLILHTIHLATDYVDTAVLTVLMFRNKLLEGRRFVDVSENALYWWFVVASWPFIYATIYLVPRMHS